MRINRPGVQVFLSFLPSFLLSVFFFLSFTNGRSTIPAHMTRWLACWCCGPILPTCMHDTPNEASGGVGIQIRVGWICGDLDPSRLGPPPQHHGQCSNERQGVYIIALQLSRLPSSLNTNGCYPLLANSFVTVYLLVSLLQDSCWYERSSDK